MRHTVAGTGLGLAGIGVGLLLFLADRLEWGLSPLEEAILIVLTGAFLVAGVLFVVAAMRGGPPKVKPLTIIYSLDGSPDMRVMLRKGRPQSVLVTVGLENPNPYNVEGVAINSLFPQGLRVTRCGGHGELLENPKGHWLATPEPVSGEPLPAAQKDYWADENVSVAGNGSKILYFKLRLIEPGSYYLLTRLFGNVPEQEQVAVLEVIETEEQCVGASINELIHDGESLAKGPPSAFESNRDAYGPWMMEVIFTTGILDEADRKWWESATGEPVAGTEDVWRANVAKRNVPALYDLRRRLSPPTDKQRRGVTVEYRRFSFPALLAPVLVALLIAVLVVAFRLLLA